MTFIRWVFYNDTGTVQNIVMQKGDFKYIPASVMALALGLDNWNVMEWTEPDPEIEAAFLPYDSEGNLRNVSVSVVNGELHFEYSEIQENDPYEIIDALTGEVE